MHTKIGHYEYCVVPGYANNQVNILRRHAIVKWKFWVFTAMALVTAAFMPLLWVLPWVGWIGLPIGCIATVCLGSWIFGTSTTGTSASFWRWQTMPHGVTGSIGQAACQLSEIPQSELTPIVQEAFDAIMADVLALMDMPKSVSSAPDVQTQLRETGEAWDKTATLLSDATDEALRQKVLNGLSGPHKAKAMAAVLEARREIDKTSKLTLASDLTSSVSA